jgi:hypothetical protein
MREPDRDDDSYTCARCGRWALSGVPRSYVTDRGRTYVFHAAGPRWRKIASPAPGSDSGPVVGYDPQGLTPSGRRPPSKSRQDDIISAIRSKGTPLHRREVKEAMKLKVSESALGHDLARMVKDGKLVNDPKQGYWPAGDQLPK